MRQIAVSSILSLLVGASASLAMAPYHFWPALFVALSALYIILEKTSSARMAALCGWLFGFGYFVCGLSWIGNALLVEGNPQAWAWPLAVAALPAFLALYFAVAAFLIRRFYDLKSAAGFLGFVGVLGLSEYLRSILFTGFPWNLFAHTWASTLPILQITALGDVYILNILTIFWAILPSWLWLHRDRLNAALPLAAVGVISMCLVLGFGLWRLQTTPTRYTDITLRIVQPNIPQAEKWRREKMVDHFMTHVRLSQRQSAETPADIILWPETALNFFLAEDRGVQGSLRAMLATHATHSTLLTGLLNFDPQTQTYQNAVAEIDAQAQTVQLYAKHHLVPFGEYIPFQKWIPLKPVAAFEGFARGAGPQTLSLHAATLRYTPAICYEIIFSGALRDPQKPPPDLIINVTNDGWYGRSAGPYQHLDQAIFRAVEEGVPVARAANTGVSALIDPLGRMLSHIPLEERGFMDGKIPRAEIFFSIPAVLKTVAFTLIMLALCTLGPILRVRN